MSNNETISEEKRQERVSKLFKIGLKFDGKQFYYKDINLHSSELLIMDDNSFDIFLKDAENKINEYRRNVNENDTLKTAQLAITEVNPIVELFSLEEITKESIICIIQKIIERDFTKKDLAIIGALEFFIKELKTAVKDNLNPNDLDKYGYSYKGILIEKSHSASRYNYDSDIYYLELKNKVKEREELLKKQYALKEKNIGVKDFTGLIDPITKKPLPVIDKTGGGDIFKITIKK